MIGRELPHRLKRSKHAFALMGRSDSPPAWLDRPIPLSLPRCILWLTESIWSRLNHVSGPGYLILTVTGAVAQSVTTLSPLIKHSSWVAVD